MGAIEVEAVTKAFGRRSALDGVSFTAEKGEVLGFLGPNGAGKTTTLRILAALIPPTSGRARVAGHDTVSESRAVRERVGYLPERVPLYDEMRVDAFLRFVADMKGIPRPSVGSAVARAIEDAGLDGAAHDRIGRLSRGFRQRVGLAQALLADPPVLLLDEPTAGLDPAQIAESRALIRRLGAERTILLSTHVLPEVSATCSRVVILARGRVVAVDAPAALAARSGRGRSVEVTVEGSADGAAEVLARVPGVRAVRAAGGNRFLLQTDADRDVRPDVARALVAAGRGVLEVRSADRTLEEVFLELVTEEPEARA